VRKSTSGGAHVDEPPDVTKTYADSNNPYFPGVYQEHINEALLLAIKSLENRVSELEAKLRS
jgi:hypothetical protein